MGQKAAKGIAEKTAAIVLMAPLAFREILGKPGEMDFLELKVSKD